MHARWLAPLLALTAALALGEAADAAPKRGTFSGSLGVTVSKGSDATVRAINVADLTVAGSKSVGKNGTFSLTLPPGAYLVVGTVARKHSSPVRHQLGLSLKSGQKRTKAKLTAKLRPKKRAKPRASRAHAARFLTQGGTATPGSTAVGINPFNGPKSGDLHYLAAGAADLVIADLVNGLPKACAAGGGNVVIREVDPERVKALEAEQELGRSPYADPSSFPPPNVVIPDVLVNGTVGADGTVSVTINDARTGAVIDTINRPASGEAFSNLEQLATQLASKLCTLTDAYELTLNVNGHGDFATHSATGAVRTTLLARGNSGQWSGAASLQWENIAFTPIVCPVYGPTAPVTQWQATLTQSGPDQLTVTWGLVGSDLSSGTIDCPPTDGSYDPPPIPGVPATSLLTAGPTSFTLPLSGGTQAISGGVTKDGRGYFNDGTLVVRPVATTR